MLSLLAPHAAPSLLSLSLEMADPWISNPDGIWVCWGSQTGASQEIARQLHARLPSPLVGRLVCMDAFKTAGLEAVSLPVDVPYAEAFATSPELLEEFTRLHRKMLVFVVSSTGQGEPPENALSFMRWLRNTKPSFTV